MEFPVILALLSLLAATLLSNLLARLRDKPWTFDPLVTEAILLLRQDRAAPEPERPTLDDSHWSRLSELQGPSRALDFEVARHNYLEARRAFARDPASRELYYPDPQAVTAAAHAVLIFTEQRLGDAVAPRLATPSAADE